MEEGHWVTVNLMGGGLNSLESGHSTVLPYFYHTSSYSILYIMGNKNSLSEIDLSSHEMKFNQIFLIMEMIFGDGIKCL